MHCTVMAAVSVAATRTESRLKSKVEPWESRVESVLAESTRPTCDFDLGWGEVDLSRPKLRLSRYIYVTNLSQF